MNTERIYLVILILAMCCAQVCLGQNKPPSPTNGTAPRVELDPQLEVNRKALLTGDVGAASIMLFHEDPNARRILIETLTQGQNSPARIAVCDALNRTRAEDKTAKNVEEFIGPLLVMLGSENPDEVRWAAEVTLIFEYEQIEQALEELLADASKPVRARVNAVHALTLRLLDMEATIKLITLVDDADRRIAAEAEKALRSLGMEVGENTEARNRIKKRIAEQGPESFLRNRL
ncbi:MAG: HEAT repeat domain-containing protein, partial [Planctomycetota bacterium]